MRNMYVPTLALTLVYPYIQGDFNIFRHHEQVEWIELNQKVIYHFAVYTTINEILIIKNCQILGLNNFLPKYLPKYQFYKKTARDKNHLFS